MTNSSTNEDNYTTTMLLIPRALTTRLQLGGTGYSRQTRLVLSYIPDWLVIFINLAVWGAMGLISPVQRPFSVNDLNIAFPYILPADQTITTPVLLTIVLSVPTVFIVLFAGIWRKSLHDLHSGLLAFILCITLTLMFTDVLKNAVGRPRPDFLARCIPDTSKIRSPDNPSLSYGLSTVDICTQPDKSVIDEGYRSFPSGHSSLAFCSMAFTSFFIGGKIKVFDQLGHSYKSIVVFLPLLGASLIAASRVSDYWHHPEDVIAGASWGLLRWPWFSYPSILSITLLALLPKTLPLKDSLNVPPPHHQHTG